MNWMLILVNIALLIGATQQSVPFGRNADNDAGLRKPRSTSNPVSGTFLYRFPSVPIGFYDPRLHISFYDPNLHATTALRTVDYEVSDPARPRAIGAAIGAVSTFLGATTTVVSLLNLDKDFGNQAMRAYYSKGSDMVFYHTTGEKIIKDGIFSIFRPFTGKRALSFVWVVNASEDTKYKLKNSRSLVNGRMTITDIRRTIETNSNQYIARTEKVKGYNYSPHNIYRQYGGSLVGLVLYLQ